MPPSGYACPQISSPSCTASTVSCFLGSCGIKQVVIGGGVSANSGLRNRIEEEGRRRGWTTFLPELRFTTDNAAMIAVVGHFKYGKGLFTPLDVAPVSRAADLNMK